MPLNKEREAVISVHVFPYYPNVQIYDFYLFGLMAYQPLLVI